jgi:tRNA pseudouridine38-40 synthase
VDTRRLFAVLEYDGTDLAGFQIQRGKRTVQGELERALHKITGEKIRVIGAGRTDTGVHAAGQGAHFDTAWKSSNEILHRALNAILPNDIAIKSLIQVTPDFSARYSARSRTYRYTLLNQTTRAPLAERYALRVAEPLDAKAMDAAARLLIGQKDFGAFGTPPRGDNTVRHVYRAQVEQQDAQVIIEIEANAFLYRMMRRIVGTLLLVGKRGMSVDEFVQVIEKKRRAGQSVPPHGLCLVQVKYDLGNDRSEE